ncbi:hypothetical protein GCM10027084_16410 [Pseudoxanthomonas sangjuensis]
MPAEPGRGEAADGTLAGTGGAVDGQDGDGFGHLKAASGWGNRQIIAQTAASGPHPLGPALQMLDSTKKDRLE